MSHIKKARMKAGLTQRQLAEILKVTPETVYLWETGKRSPSVGRMKYIAATIPVTVKQLLDEKVARHE